ETLSVHRLHVGRPDSGQTLSGSCPEVALAREIRRGNVQTRVALRRSDGRRNIRQRESTFSGPQRNRDSVRQETQSEAVCQPSLLLQQTHANPASFAWAANSALAATTSSNVPWAVTAPSRMKSTRSESRMVLSRCATAITVTSPRSARIAL